MSSKISDTPEIRDVLHCSPEQVAGNQVLRKIRFTLVSDALASMDTAGCTSKLALGRVIGRDYFDTSRIAHGTFATVYNMRNDSLFGVHSVAMKAHRLCNIITRDYDYDPTDDYPGQDFSPNTLEQCRVEKIVQHLEDGTGEVDESVSESCHDSEVASREESTMYRLCNSVVLADVCPFFPLTFYQRQGSVCRQYFMEYSPLNLLNLMPSITSLGLALSLVRQQLLSCVCLNVALGVCHNDMYPQNVLVQPVTAAIYRFRVDGSVVEWFNHGYMIQTADFGLASGRPTLETNSDTLSSEYYDEDQQLPCSGSNFVDGAVRQFDTYHVLQFPTLPAFARDVVAVLASWKGALCRKQGLGLSTSDHASFSTYIDAAAATLGKALFPAPGVGDPRPSYAEAMTEDPTAAARQCILTFVRNIMRADFLKECGCCPNPSDHLLPMDHLDVPLHQFLFPNTLVSQHPECRRSS